MKKYFLTLIGILLLIFIGISCSREASLQQTSAILGMVEQDTSGFARANGPQPLSFPEDFGPHNEYLTEWWYYTGNLDTEDGRHFGYQLTFFRRALDASQPAAGRESAWAFDQVYLAHFALTDVDGGTHRESERFARGAAGIAGAQSPPYRVWLEDWEVEQTGNGEYLLHATTENFGLTLNLTDGKAPILQGDAGYSQKGPEPGNASIYFSHTRLISEGEVIVDGEKFDVTGLSWMDHEYSTSALSEGQIGWDWFSIQLDDETEMMLFHIRRDDGSIDVFSSGTLINPQGETTRLDRDQFTITVRDTWESPSSGGEYPIAWEIAIPSQNITLSIEPYLEDQEMNLQYKYWEGAVRVTGVHDGRAVEGAGYVEMTGYSGPFSEDF